MRGVISTGLARMDKVKGIYFGSPLVEAAKGETQSNMIGVSFGDSYSNYHSVYNIYHIPYIKHIKGGRSENARNYLSCMVPNWPLFWEKSRHRDKDLSECIKRMAPEDEYSS